jgi:hypothetical protein
MRNKFKIKSPYPLKQEGEIRYMEEEPEMLMGQPSLGMFSLPMAAVNYINKSTGPRDPYELSGRQKPTTEEFKNKIQSFKLPQDNTGAIDTVVPKKKRKKSNEPRKTTKGKGRNFRTTKEGAGMTEKGVKEYRRKNPGSKLKTAVTGKVKPGSKAAKRRKSFCARSKGWTGERGRAARRRWKC